MSRIGASGTGIQFRLLNQLNFLNRAIEQSSLRLSTGKRINSGADDPAGLIQASALRSELTSVESALGNVQAAQSLISAADSALSQVASHLTTIRSKALESVGDTLSEAAKEANQAEIDAAIKAINLITATTYNGRRLLDGSQGFIISGRDSSEVQQLDVFSRNTKNTSQTIDVNVSVAAEQAELTYTGASGNITADAVFSLTGSDGSTTVTVTNGEALTDVADRINEDTTVTGITASVNGDDLVLTSKDFGADETVSVDLISGSFATAGTGQGVDAQAVINGVGVTADGLKFRVRTNSINFDIQLDSSFTTGAINTITVSGSALSFKLDANYGSPAVISLPNVHASSLGGISGLLSEVATGGGKSALEDPAAAVNIADEAIARISVWRARVGAFAGTTLDSASAVLESQQVNLTSAISQIEDTDVALESALLVRNQLLAENAAAALALVSNNNANILPLIQQAAFAF